MSNEITKDEAVQHCKTKLEAAYAPSLLVVECDELSQHFYFKVVSEVFRDKNLLARHQSVYDLFHEELRDGQIHALSMSLHTEGE